MPEMCWNTMPNRRGGNGTPASNTVVVTPENAATYGFDKLGATINTDTGGIVDPFSGAADGFNRDARNTAIQTRALQNPNPVSPGYSQIMSNPANRAFNDRLLNDPMFAMDNLNRGFNNQDTGGNYSFFAPLSGGSVSATSRNPLPGTGTNPITTGPATSRNPLPGTGTNPISRQTTTAPGTGTVTNVRTSDPNSKVDPLTGGQALNTAGGTGTLGETTALPLPDQSSQFYASIPSVTVGTPEYAPNRDGVINAMMRRFNGRRWI